MNDSLAKPRTVSSERQLSPRIERVRPGRWLQLPPPAGFAWTRVHLPIAGLAEALVGLRIVHLTDFHIRRCWFKAYDELIQMIREDPPDLILLTGDLVEHRRLRKHEVDMARRLVDSLSARIGIFGIYGNHDGDFLAARLASQGMHAIENTQVTLEHDGATIELVGLPGVNRDDLEEEFLNRIPAREESGGIRIVMGHYPDQISRVEKLKADIMLAGHTHGGQCCLPGGRAIFTHDSLPRKFATGVHRWGDTWLIVSRGIGYAGIPLRVWCPSEVVELVLERG